MQIGLDIVLTRYVLSIIEANIQDVIKPVLKKENFMVGDINQWAIHPGGKTIVYKVEKKLNLSTDSVSASRKIIGDFGNMSSPTILFVLNEILNQKGGNNDDLVYVLAFGPGLTVESALMKTQNR